MPKFSVIMQSYLGNYDGAASNREEKIRRAINSVIDQSLEDWELIVVADGCEETYKIVADNCVDKRVDCYLIPKQTMWTGSCRNFGISKATGEYIVYLDIDDYFGPNHLLTISEELQKYDWVWFNDIVNGGNGESERTALINHKYQYGTANICHKRLLGVKWTSSGYGLDDYGLGQSLIRASKNFAKIKTPAYIVCHIPNKIDY